VLSTEWKTLVPKLGLGTPSAKLRFAILARRQVWDAADADVRETEFRERRYQTEFGVPMSDFAQT